MQDESKMRMNRRVLGQVAARTAELPMEKYIDDPRTDNVQRSLRSVVVPVLAGIIAGCKGFGELEQLTDNLGKGALRALGLRGRLPDTTARDLCGRLNPHDVEALLYSQIRTAHRRKQLVHDLPVRALLMDGKATSTTFFDLPDAKEKFGQENSAGRSLVRTVTCCLGSVAARPCIAAVPIRPETNEMGMFIEALDEVLTAYGRSLFDLVMYDSGACSLENANAIKARDLDYVFILDAFQRTLYEDAGKMLGRKTVVEALATSTDLDGGDIVQRHIWMTPKMEGWLDWKHLKTVIRVQSTRTDKQTGAQTVENRYYLCSLAMDAMTPDQWLTLIRRRWSVENQCHNTFDKILSEDTRSWMRRPQGMLVLLLLRRIADNTLAIYRAVTTRAEHKRLIPWKTLMRQIYIALVKLTCDDMKGVRRRGVVFG